LARVAESSSIEHLCEIKVLTSIEIYGKNDTLANFQPVTANAKKKTTGNKMNDKNKMPIAHSGTFASPQRTGDSFASKRA